MKFFNSTFENKPSRNYTNNLRYIKLAIDLQVCARKKSQLSRPSIRITKSALEQSYYDCEHAKSLEGARKMAIRDLQYMDDIFGLHGDNLGGYYMGSVFPRFLQMFESWLDRLGTAKPTDGRLHIMLEGIVTSIKNGMRSDPICTGSLANALQNKYGRKNIRDIKEPLAHLFSDHVVTSYLMITDDETDNQDSFDDEGLLPDRLIVLKDEDPLLLRLKNRDEVGNNEDISINLAIPGRIRNVFSEHIDHFDDGKKQLAKSIANAVVESHCWQGEDKHHYVPYILFREGETGPLLLTLWNIESGNFSDVPFSEVKEVPTQNQLLFLPYDVSLNTWEQFRSISK